MMRLFVLMIAVQSLMFGQNFWQRTEPYSAVLNRIHFGGGDTVYGTLNSGFTRSTNNGTVWSSHVIVSFVTDMAVAPNGYIFLSQNQQKISRSTNKGNSFTNTGNGINEPSCSSVLAAASGTLLAGTTRGIYRSTNNGDLWTKTAGKEQLGADTTVSAFALLGTTLYAATNSNQIYPSKSFLLKSTDDGVTWTKGSASLDTVSIYRIKVLQNGTVVARTSSGVRMTTDGGNSWSTIGFYQESIYDIAAAVDGSLYVSLGNASTLNTLYRTTNNGADWTHIPTPLSGGGSVNINNAGHLFIGREQMYRSTDNGANWKALPVSFPNVTAFRESPKNELFVSAGGSAYQSLYRSTDFGLSWIPLTTGVVGVPSVGFYGDTTLVADNAYAATLFRSTDGTKTFKKMTDMTGISGNINAVIGTSFRSIITATSTGIYRSVDHGKVWTKTSNSPLQFLQQLPNGAIYGYRTFSGSGVHRSLDSGSTWTELKAGMGNTLIHSLAFAPNGNLFCGSDAGLFRSTDAGDNWVRIDTQNVKPYGIYVAVSADGKLFFGGAKNGVNAQSYRSTDNGASWSQVPNNISAIDNNASIRTLFTSSNGYLFAGTSSGLFKSISSITAVDDADRTQPQKFILEQNFPNPFNPSTHIRYSVQFAGRVTLKVFDQLGREVSSPVDNVMSAGEYELEFDASHLSSGIYYYTLRFAGLVQTKKMILIR